MKFLNALGLTLACSLVTQGQDLRQTPAAKTACGLPDAQFKTEWVPGTAARPNPREALVYLVEVADPVAATCLGRCGALSRVGLDGSWLGATQGNSYLTTMVNPGAHHLCANIESHAKTLSHLVALYGFEAEAGRTYFFRISTSVGTAEGGTFGFSLMPMNEDEGRMLTAAYPYSKSTQK